MIEIDLTQGKKAIIDKEDFERVSKYKWHYNHRYAKRSVGRKKVFLHHFILNQEIPKDKVVDHINGDTLDNRKSNLRICDENDNKRNLKKRSGKKSKYKGAYYYENLGLYKCGLTYNNERIHIGYFDDEIACANAYNYHAKKYFKEFANLNDVRYMEKLDWEKHLIKKKTSNKHVGVTKSGNKWIARATVKGERVYIGSFETEEEAVNARKDFLK